ncbi:MAG TPA: DUF3667 domain-containing protein [Permianibacter sp.]|nr:DUF3667 domain-containing protein [Permianibacter sp.]
MLSTTVIEPAARLCQNCQTPMQGPFCYQCGQHEKTSLRHAGLLLRDILHDVFNLDSRAVRTLKPLLFKPGFLTLEYFAGRRQRYVPPLRLYVIASLVFFLIAGLMFSLGKGFEFNNDEQAAEELLKEPEMQQALQNPQVAAAMQNAAPAMRDAMAKQGMVTPAEPALPELPKVEGTEQTATPPPAKTDAKVEISIFEPVPFLPDVANQWIKELNSEVSAKAKRIQDDPKKLAEVVLSVLPQSMFILLPLFALLLKLFYPFANRLYMEHLIVALHSHCFMFILFTLLMVANEVAGQSQLLTSQLTWLDALMGTVTGLLLAFGVPLYLYLMQKRVYGQGHLLTFSKFLMIGVLYLTLLSVVIAVDIVVGILRM